VTRLFHISDIHFGAEDAEALAWFEDAVRAAPPDAIVVTGDLTMRARRREFEQASEWLAGLEAPVTVEVGNHDLPYFNPLLRFVAPYRRFQRLERVIERPLTLEGVTIIPLKTTARFQWRLNWSKGRVGRRGLESALRMSRAAPPGHVKIVAAHHPLIEAATRGTADTRGGREALEALAEARVDAVLSGHVHDPFNIVDEAHGHPVRLIGAGTLSARLRDTPPSFNELRIGEGGLDTLVHRMG